jgi:hypothetical protein
VPAQISQSESESGLPDDIFSDKKFQTWVNLGGSCNRRCIFYDYLIYFTAIWYIVWPFGIFYGYLLYFHPFW